MEIDVVQMIGSLGFPIVACIALFWKLNASDALHKQETDKLSEAINGMNALLGRLMEKLGGDEPNVK